MNINLSGMIEKIKASPLYPKMGMVASHLGVVRSTSTDGKPVKALDIKFNRDLLAEISRDIKDMDGIFEVLIEVNEGRLQVGDDIMAVAVGGDIRPHVFDALIRAVDRIKKEASFKREVF